MRNMQTRKESGRASALRYNFTPSTTVFKTRCQSCRIAVHAAIKKLMDSKEKRPKFCENCKSFGDQQSRILSPDGMNLRFTEN